MAGRPKVPQQGKLAATAALLVLAGWFAPAGASLDTDAKEVDSLADDHLLKPRVEAAARKVFADDDREAAVEDDTEINAEVDAVVEENEAAIAEPRLRRLSNDSAPPFKRQMYRKDI